MTPTRILLVEDNADDAELTLWALGEAGLDSVTLARDGAEALRLLLGGLGVDLVLLDLRLPLLDGLEVLGRMRSDPTLKPLRVVVLTSSENPMDMAACKALGVAAYLSKPLDVRNLLRHLG